MCQRAWLCMNNTTNNHKFKKLLSSWIFTDPYFYLEGSFNLFTSIKAIYVCISQTSTKSHSLRSKVFSEIIHLIFKILIFLSRLLQNYTQARSFIKTSVRYGLFFHELITLQKLWKFFVIQSKKLLFSRDIKIFVFFSFSFHTSQIQ